MANTIKSIPELKEKAAVTFNKKVFANAATKSSVNFSKQVSIASQILAKAKI